MRRLDTRPFKKLRNPGRHLRALARWPERIAESVPDASVFTGELFWNFRIPVYSKLVEPPHATPATQRACIAAIFAAAEALERSARRPAGCRVACLITTPWMFSSEVTLFFDDAYFRTLLPPLSASRTYWESGWVEGAPADAAEIAAIMPQAPQELMFLGGLHLTEFDSERGGKPMERVNWVWAYPQR